MLILLYIFLIALKVFNVMIEFRACYPKLSTRHTDYFKLKEIEKSADTAVSTSESPPF